jgi:hypothetical protein
LSAAPADVTVECDLVPEAVVLTVTDNCDTPVVVYAEESTQDDNENNVKHYNYTITRTWRATDVAGNFTESVQLITVQDVTAPSITNVADVTVNCEDNTTSAFRGVAEGDDNCSPFEITQSDVSTQDDNENAEAHYNYTITRTWRATDIAGNFTESVQLITVQDVTAPSITDVADVTLNCENDNSSVNTGVAEGEDNCSPFEITQSDTSTQDDNENKKAHYNYTITRTWRATDVAGNFTESVQVITVQDVTNPTITDVADVTVDCGASLLPSNTGGMATATDNCTTMFLISISYIDSAIPTVCGGSFIRTWTAEDASGNTSSSEQIITINAAALPRMTTPDAVTISVACGADPVPSTLPFTNGLSDGCLLSGTSFSSTFALVKNTCGGIYIETWTAEDICGRPLKSVSRTVTILQDMASLESTIYFASEAAMPEQARLDLLNLYIHLSNIPVTNLTHAAAFGGGETLTPGVYSTAAAGSLGGELILDGENKENSLFIIKYNGAFSVVAASKVRLINGQKASNVFWVAEGAISVGASSIIKGTLLAHAGAVSLGATCDLEGRMFSTAGATVVGAGAKLELPNDPTGLPIICVNNSDSGDALLGSVAKFAVFTGAGAISNIGASGIIGDIGSNAGAISGFEGSKSLLVSNIHKINDVTIKAKADLKKAYLQLTSIEVTSIPAGVLTGVTLTPGVHAIAAAGTLTGTVTLDGEGDADALFVIKFGGAFSTAAQSRVRLINGARYGNVFWVAEGAISLGASSFMKGTLISNAAVTMGARANLEGRMLTNSGAISLNIAVVYIGYLKCVESSNKTVESPIELDATTLMAYPNPFSFNTTIRFTIPYLETNATLVMYDLKGSLIKRLYSGKANANQQYEIQFNGQNIPAGVYFFRLTTSKETKNFKVVAK